MTLIVDSFAGGGGASVAIQMALGRSPDIAINHDEIALGMHEANHPETLHLPENVWQVDLDDHAKGQTVGLLWASPDCRHFSKARGAAPTSRSVRGLAWTIVKFVKQLKHRKPRVIVMENVEEFITWEEFPEWSQQLKRHGYAMKCFELRACDYGAPTIRKRLFIVMRCDGLPIVEPQPTHGAPDNPRVLSGELLPWRTAAEIIDWSLPVPSIFETAAEIKAKLGLTVKRPLVDNTLRRIATGVYRYVIETKEPYFVSYAQQGGMNRTAAEPLHTVTAPCKDQNTIIVPKMMRASHIQRDFGNGVGHSVDRPIATITSGGGGHAALVSAFLAQHNTGVVGHSAEKPFSTITGRGTQQAIVAAHMLSMKGTDRRDGPLTDPLPTVCAGGNHAALVAAFMIKYYGTAIGAALSEPVHSATTKQRFGLVTMKIAGEVWAIVDIGMRTLYPRELFNAQGFPADYIIDRQADGTPITKTQQIHKCGNSVSPQPAAAVLRANCAAMAFVRRAA